MSDGVGKNRTVEAEIEVRHLDVGTIEVRADGVGEQMPRLVGYAAKFNQETDLGYMREIIDPGAFASAIRSDDVRALIDHDSALVLGRNRSGTLMLSEDAVGLRVEITPPKTTYAADLIESVRRGDISGMSFGFRAKRRSYADLDTDKPLRRLQDVQLFEVSVVTFPAYQNTEIALRDLKSARGQPAQALSETNEPKIAAAMAVNDRLRRELSLIEFSS